MPFTCGLAKTTSPRNNFHGFCEKQIKKFKLEGILARTTGHGGRKNFAGPVAMNLCQQDLSGNATLMVQELIILMGAAGFPFKSQALPQLVRA
jgi:hypothetical protein